MIGQPLHLFARRILRSAIQRVFILLSACRQTHFTAVRRRDFMWWDVDIEFLHKAAKDRRTGYVEAVMEAGRQYGPPREVNGKIWIRIHISDRDRIQEEFNPAAPVIQSAKIKEGWGDKIHAVAGPIGRAVNWPCMKGDGTTDLKPGAPCDKGRAIANTIGEKAAKLLDRFGRAFD